MGILNVTPDSFSDGGHFFSLPQAVQRGVEMVEEGADIIDVGGESSRPGAEPVSEVEELRRVIPVIKALAGKIGKTLISVDTYKPAVAKAAVDAGAHIINDITGLRDERMVEVAAETGAYVVVMHMQGIPRTMQHQPKYHCVTAEVYDWLAAACARAKAAGVKPHRLIIDPGIGFGKATEHNLTLLQRLRDLQTLGYPVLVGTSRKSVIGNVLNVPVTERWEGNAATVALAVGEGVDIVRVHDVKSMRKVVQMSEAIIHGRVVAGG
ncbi:MAG TPA: dihydropteroate synthase [Firmicutes bacterium]|nr:dihydropteroate synthase [Bacillota bacterium]